jgi:hypothetical protein
MINRRLPDRQNPVLTSLILAFLSLLTETMIVGRWEVAMHDLVIRGAIVVGPL